MSDVTLSRCFLCHGNETPLESTGCRCKDLFAHEACINNVYDLKEVCSICEKQFTNKLFSKELSLDETFETLIAKFEKMVPPEQSIRITAADLLKLFKQDYTYNVSDLYKTILRNNKKFIKYIPVNHPDYKEIIEIYLISHDGYKYEYIKHKIDKQMKKYILTISPEIFYEFDNDERHDVEFCSHMASIRKINCIPHEMRTCDMLKIAFANGFIQSIDVLKNVVDDADDELKNIILTNYIIKPNIYSDGIILLLKSDEQCDVNSRYYIKSPHRPVENLISYSPNTDQHDINFYSRVTSSYNRNHIGNNPTFINYNETFISPMQQLRPMNHQQFAYTMMPYTTHYNPRFY